MGTGLLADRHQGGVTAHQIQDLRGDQLVIEHHFGLLDLLQRLEGQQARIAGARPHQHHLADLALGLVQPLIEPAFGTLPVLLLDQTGEGIGGEGSLPETAAIRDGREQLLGLAAHPAGELRQPAQMAGQQTFEPLAQQPHQYRSLAAAGDGDHQRGSVYDGGEDEAGTHRVVHHIDEQAEPVGALVDEGIDLEIVGGGHHQLLARQMRWGETLGKVGETAGKFGKARLEFG
ncbi:hypothetical protein D3C84_781400 [compost metagenome]